MKITQVKLRVCLRFGNSSIVRTRFIKLFLMLFRRQIVSYSSKTTFPRETRFVGSQLRSNSITVQSTASTFAWSSWGGLDMVGDWDYRQVSPIALPKMGAWAKKLDDDWAPGGDAPSSEEISHSNSEEKPKKRRRRRRRAADPIPPPRPNKKSRVLRVPPINDRKTVLLRGMSNEEKRDALRNVAREGNTVKWMLHYARRFQQANTVRRQNEPIEDKLARDALVGWTPGRTSLKPPIETLTNACLEKFILLVWEQNHSKPAVQQGKRYLNYILTSAGKPPLNKYFRQHYKVL